MKTTTNTHYERIAETIDYIKANFKEQPSLETLAQVACMSPSHFQRVFSEWAGVSPKKFIQFLSIEYAKHALRIGEQSVLSTAYDTGLSSAGRLHDLFINIEGMTPGEFKNGGENLTIDYDYALTPFGKVIVASTRKGLCHLFFENDEAKALVSLKTRFPQADYQQRTTEVQSNALSCFDKNWKHTDELKLHIKGTDFQLKVWDALLKLPLGSLVSYGKIAGEIDRPKASRAVGTAIGSNPIAFLIPCHRVIQQSGNLGGYMWGETRKSAIIAWEASSLGYSDQL